MRTQASRECNEMLHLKGRCSQLGTFMPLLHLLGSAIPSGKLGMTLMMLVRKFLVHRELPMMILVDTQSPRSSLDIRLINLLL